MEVKTSFQIDWTLNNREAYRKAETTLLNEGWTKTNYTEPSELLDTDFSKKYTTWFERVWL